MSMQWLCTYCDLGKSSNTRARCTDTHTTDETRIYMIKVAQIDKQRFIVKQFLFLSLLLLVSSDIECQFASLLSKIYYQIIAVNERAIVFYFWIRQKCFSVENSVPMKLDLPVFCSFFGKLEKFKLRMHLAKITARSSYEISDGALNMGLGISLGFLKNLYEY